MSTVPTPLSVEQAAAQYVRAGLVLVALDRGSKGPHHKGWNKRESCISTIARAAECKGNIGIAHAYSGTCCIDIDDMVLAMSWFSGAGLDLSEYWTAHNAVRWSSGMPNRGKLLYRLPAGVAALPTRIFIGEGVELRCATATGLTEQDVLPPSIHPGTLKPYAWLGPRKIEKIEDIPIIPADLLAFWQTLTAPQTSNGTAAPSGMDHAEIQAKLDRTDPATLDYNGWLKVGMALHHETRGANEGQQMWERWSYADGKNKKHNEGRANFDGRYASFHLDREDPITVRSLERLATVPVDMASEYEALPAPEATAPAAAPTPNPPTPKPKPKILEPDGRITAAEWAAAPKPPQEIVHQLLLQDACGFVAPGGTGKTTVAIVEYIHIILERPLWGRRIEKPGPIALLTAEDSRQITIDRLKWCMDAMRLTPAEQRRVVDNFYIDDVALKGTQLVRAFEHGNLKATILQDELIAKYRDRGISVLHLDPASLLGPGEVHGNDGGAAMNRAMRRIAIECQCCVQLINHVAQAVARGGIMDQYAARGTTAIVDNSRGQRQMVRLKSRDLLYDGAKYHVPTAAISDEDIKRGRLLMILVHKLSYVEVDPTPIFIARHDYEFAQLPHETRGSAVEKTVNQEMEIIAGFILKEAANDRRHSADSIASAHLQELGGLKRQRARDLIAEGLRIGRFVSAELPAAQRKGSKTEYLVVADSDDIDQEGA